MNDQSHEGVVLLVDGAQLIPVARFGKEGAETDVLFQFLGRLTHRRLRFVSG